MGTVFSVVMLAGKQLPSPCGSPNNTGPLSTLHVRCCGAGSVCGWVLSARRVLLEERPRLAQLCSRGRGGDEVDSETLKQDTWLEQGGSNEV